MLDTDLLAKRAKNAEYQRKYYHTHKDTKQLGRRKAVKRYGISLEQFNELKLRQGGVCAICGTSEPGGTGEFAVDQCTAIPAWENSTTTPQPCARPQNT